MSNHKYHRCPYCRHMIKDKFILGTFHFCLLPEERDEIDRRRSDAMRQYRQQQAFVARFPTCWYTAQDFATSAPTRPGISRFTNSRAPLKGNEE